MGTFTSEVEMGVIGEVELGNEVLGEEVVEKVGVGVVVGVHIGVSLLVYGGAWVLLGEGGKDGVEGPDGRGGKALEGTRVTGAGGRI